MVKFSYIVPTLLKFDNFYEQISKVLSLDCIKEVIIINNSDGKDLEILSEKIKEIKSNSSSLFCNGSWNIGVEYSESDWIILSTDDILYDVNIIKDISNKIDSVPNLGLLGMNWDVVGELPEYKEIGIYKAGTQREYCYGIMMFLKRINYTPIPVYIRHHYGDDYLYYTMLDKGLDNYTIFGDTFRINTEIGSMSGSEETKDRIEKDRKYWMSNYYEKYYNYGKRCG